jgi:hypothetical protein
MRGIALLALLTLSSGCATLQARRAVEQAPLDVPPVPPRVIVPEIDEVEPEPSIDPNASNRQSAPRTDPAPKPADPPKPGTVEPPKPADPPRPEEAPRVRTPQMANDDQAERTVRSVMARAQGTLNNVNYQLLSNPARQQYDTARRFLAQADNALKIRNYIFARNLADKAETLARQLGK